jgi:hypothetical protein
MFTFASRRRPAEHSQAASRRPAASTRLAVEALEDRTVPGFLTPVTSPGGGDALTLADLNHDRFADVVVIGSNKTVSVNLGNGDGTFGKAVKLGGAKGTLYWVIVGDFNGDGNPDVEGFARGNNLVYHYNSGWSYYEGTLYTNVWLGRGDGTFGTLSTTSVHTTFFPYGPFTYNPLSATGDFNQDGIDDSAGVYTPSGESAVTVWLDNGDGTYQPPQIYAPVSTPATIAAGDVNGDGWTDLVVVNNLDSGKSTLSVLFNDGSW